MEIYIVTCTCCNSFEGAYANESDAKAVAESKGNEWCAYTLRENGERAKEEQE